jgi:hypothetical protein
MENTNQKTETKEIILTIDGDLMDGGSVDYRTVFDVIDGSVGAIESFSRLSNFSPAVSFRVRPPKKGSFEISLLAVQLLTNAVPLLPYVGTIKDVTSFFIEYMKIKKALKGEDLKKENIQTNENGGVTIKNNSGSIVYNDNRKITNVNIVAKAVDDPHLNKKIDKIVTALEKNEQIDTVTFTDPELNENNILEISKNEVDYFKYEEKFEEKSDNLVGYVRKIDNKTNNGMITVTENDKEKSIIFELDIKDIKVLEKVVRNLALAEANKTRVVFSGEKTLDSKGKIKKIIVTDVDIVDKSFNF